jgi:hypothetical protein
MYLLMAMTSTTNVINLKGRKPQSLKDGEIYIGRRITMGGWNIAGSKWQNPYSAKKYPLNQCLEMYKKHILSNSELMDNLHELKGKTLACWCKPNKCHGDVTK